MILLYYYFNSILKTVNVILDVRVDLHCYFGFSLFLSMALIDSSVLC